MSIYCMSISISTVDQIQLTVSIQLCSSFMFSCRTSGRFRFQNYFELRQLRFILLISRCHIIKHIIACNSCNGERTRFAHFHTMFCAKELLSTKILTIKVSISFISLFLSLGRMSLVSERVIWNKWHISACRLHANF